MLGSYHACDTGFFFPSFFLEVVFCLVLGGFVCLGFFYFFTFSLMEFFVFSGFLTDLIAFICIIQVSNMPPVIFCCNKEISLRR